MRVEELVCTLPAGPADLGVAARLAESAEVRVLLRGDAHLVRVQVEAGLRIAYPCDRCLDEVVLEVPVAFAEEWHLVPPGHRGEGVEAGEDADGEGVLVRQAVAADALDLTPAFWQNAGLALPAKVLCSEECLGLCPSCGVNRNRSSCACAQVPVDPRLAALGRWRPTTGR